MFTLDNIVAGYAETTVLRGVSLTVPDGSVVALLGANGAGKTTLLRVASGLLRPTSGTMTLDGIDVTGHRPHQLAGRGVCHVPEGRGIFRRLSVRENLVVQAGGHHQPPPRQTTARAAVDRAAGLFPVLGRRLDQQAGTLSGGEQQMLALARAFVTDAPLILADELSMGLAPVIVDQIFDAVGVLRSEGRSVLLVEQYVERAVGVADYVYILNKGRVVFTGLPAECSSSAVFARYLQGAA